MLPPRVGVVLALSVIAVVVVVSSVTTSTPPTELQQLPLKTAALASSSPSSASAVHAPVLVKKNKAASPTTTTTSVKKAVAQKRIINVPKQAQHPSHLVSQEQQPHVIDGGNALAAAASGASSTSKAAAAAVKKAGGSASSSSAKTAKSSSGGKKNKAASTASGHHSSNTAHAAASASASASSSEPKLSKAQIEAKKKLWDLKLKLKGLLYRQRYEENQALGVRKAALQEWAEYKLNLDDAEAAARESARFSRAILKYARKAVQAKKKEQTWAQSAYKDLHAAMKEEVDHPEHIHDEHHMTRHEKLMAASDPVTNYELDPFHDRHAKRSALQKAEDELEARVFAGDASKSEISAYHELNRMHHWTDKKRRNTYMGEVLEIVRKKKYGREFNQLMSKAEAHARTARKYTRISSRIVQKAARMSRDENKVLGEIRKLEKNPTSMQKARRVVVQLVDPPPPEN